MAAARLDSNPQGELRVGIVGHDFLETLTIYQYLGLSNKVVMVLTVAAREVMSISISFPSSSFRGLIVTATAFGVGDEEKLRFSCALKVDDGDGLKDW